MEIHHQHHHDHPQHKEKMWKHYALEFFMLFLAVTLGFYSESIRESITDHKKEKVFVQSMVEDLKADTARITIMTRDLNGSLTMIDSLMHLFRKPNRDQYGQTMYYFARVITAKATRFELNDRTYEQMKSSGSLRLISDQEVADSVLKYYAAQATFKQQEEVQLYRMNTYSDFAGNVFDATVFQDMLQKFPYKVNPPSGNPKLLTNDPAIINDYLGKLHYFSAILAINVSRATLNKEATLRLIQLLQSKYRLQ